MAGIAPGPTPAGAVPASSPEKSPTNVADAGTERSIPSRATDTNAVTTKHWCPSRSPNLTGPAAPLIDRAALRVQKIMKVTKPTAPNDIAPPKPSCAWKDN
jgi:hypothetical protein